MFFVKIYNTSVFDDYGHNWFDFHFIIINNEVNKFIFDYRHMKSKNIGTKVLF